MPTMDWKKESDGGEREVYPSGTYHVECTGWSHCETSKGNKQVRWFTEILDGDHKGKKLVDHTVLTEAALWRIARLVQGFGVIVEDTMDTEGQAFEAVLNACIGRRAYWFTTKDEQYNNNKIDRYEVDDQQGVVTSEGTVDADCPFENEDGS